MKNELKEILKDEVARVKFQRVEVLFFGCVIGLALFFSLRGVQLRMDDSITVYQCPETYELDANIKLKELNDFTPDDLEDEIRSFMRKFVKCLYPKNSQEANGCYKYVIRHSNEGKLQKEYRSYLRDIEKVTKRLSSGQITEFFPKDSTKYQIRKKDGELRWIFEIEGYLNNRISLLKDDRGVVTLRFEIILGEASSIGSYSGLYVDSYEILHMEDVVAKDVKNVKSN